LNEKDKNAHSFMEDSTVATPVGDLAVICTTAKKITNIAISSSQINYLATVKESRIMYQKDLQNAIQQANELLSIVTSLNTPLSTIPSHQYSTLHGSFVAVTTWLLHLLPECMKNEPSESESLAENDIREHTRQSIQTLVELAQHASFLEVPLHLPLHTQVLNNCAQELPIGMVAPVLFKLCSSLEASYPNFKDWEALLIPILKEKLEETPPQDLDLLCQEMNKIIQVTQQEYQWELRWENALQLLQSLKVKYDIQRAKQQQQQQQDMNHDGDENDQYLSNVPCFEHTSISIQLLSEPLEKMLKQKKRKLKRLSKEIHDVLSVFSNTEDRSQVDLSPAGLEQLLSRLFMEDEHDYDDDGDETKDELIDSNDSENEDISKFNNVDTENDLKGKLGDKDMELEDAIALVRDIEEEEELEINISSKDKDREGLEQIDCIGTNTETVVTESTPSFHHEMMYYRDESNLDWSIPDITSQCVEWNHNKSLRFTKEYEEELIRQISEEEDEDEEYYNNLAVYLSEDDDDDLD